MLHLFKNLILNYYLLKYLTDFLFKFIDYYFVKSKQTDKPFLMRLQTWLLMITWWGQF